MQILFLNLELNLEILRKMKQTYLSRNNAKVIIRSRNYQLTTPQEKTIITMCTITQCELNNCLINIAENIKGKQSNFKNPRIKTLQTAQSMNKRDRFNYSS